MPCIRYKDCALGGKDDRLSSAHCDKTLNSRGAGGIDWLYDKVPNALECDTDIYIPLKAWIDRN